MSSAKHTGIALVLALAVAGAIAVNNASITFQLSARDLPSFDPFGGYPDPYVILTYENPPNPPRTFGETSKLADTQNPDWPDKFNVIYINGSSQTLKFDVWDEDTVDADDYMGGFTIRLDEIMSTFGGILTRDIQDGNAMNGQMILTANVTNAM